MTPLLRRASWRHLRRHPWLAGLSVLGVAVAVAVVVGIDLANASATRAFDTSVEGVAGRATHEITGGPSGLDERLYVELRTVHGLRDSTPVVESTVVAADGSGRTFQLLGIDVFVDRALRTFSPSFDPSGDGTAFLTRPGAVYLGTRLASELEVGIGDGVRIRAGGEEHRLEVVGLLSPASDLARQALRDLLIVDLASAQEILGKTGRLTRIDLTLGEGDEAAARETAFQRALPAGCELRAKSARSGALSQMTRAFRLNLTALSLLALVVGMFLIFNTMTFAVVQRRPVLGTLRALGATRRQVFAWVVSEAAVIGLAGSAIGVAAGIALAEGLLTLVIRTINDLYFSLSVSSVAIPWQGMVKGLALGVGGTVLAALRPAAEAASAPPRLVLIRSVLEAKARRAVGHGATIAFALAALAGALLVLPTRSLVVSFGGLFLVVLAFAALVPAATVAATTLLKAPMRRLFGVLGTMAARGVATTLSRTGVAVAALVIAVSVTIGVGVMVASFRSTLVSWLDVTLAADVYVAPAEPGSRGGARTLDPEVLAIVESAPQVAFATTYRRVRVDTPLGPIDLGALRAERPAFDAYDFIHGDPDEIWPRFQSEEAVIVSETLAYHHRLEIGSRLELTTGRGRQQLAVAGIYHDYGSTRGVATVSRATYDRYWDDPAIFSIGIFTHEGADRERLIEDLRARVGARQGVRWIANRDLREASLEIFDRTFVITGVLRLLAVVVAFIGVLAALMALQLERARELGVLRATGLTPRQVWTLVIAECGLMGTISGVLALPLGGALAAMLIHIINRRSFGWTLDMELPLAILGQAVLLAVVAALSAGLYPAYKLSKTSPALALREE